MFARWFVKYSTHVESFWSAKSRWRDKLVIKKWGLIHTRCLDQSVRRRCNVFQPLIFPVPANGCSIAMRNACLVISLDLYNDAVDQSVPPLLNHEPLVQAWTGAIKLDKWLGLWESTEKEKMAFQYNLSKRQLTYYLSWLSLDTFPKDLEIKSLTSCCFLSFCLFNFMKCLVLCRNSPYSVK